METKLDENQIKLKAKVVDKNLIEQNKSLNVITPPSDYNPHVNLGGMFYTVNENKTELSKPNEIKNSSDPNLHFFKRDLVLNDIKSKTM